MERSKLGIGQHRSDGPASGDNGQSTHREQTLTRQTRIVRDSGQMSTGEQERRDRERNEWANQRKGGR
jgi:hypothetical protein